MNGRGKFKTYLSFFDRIRSDELSESIELKIKKCKPLLCLCSICGQCPPYKTASSDVDIERANEALQSGEMRLRRGKKDKGGTP
jgi:hypothetical protein